MKHFTKIGLAVIALWLLLLPLLLYCQYGHFKRTSQYAQPNLPYGPKDQEPWYQSRKFEETDFQEEQTPFELQRQETESLRHVVGPLERENHIKKQDEDHFEPGSRIGLYP
jgi:hypothetical protein